MRAPRKRFNVSTGKRGDGAPALERVIKRQGHALASRSAIVLRWLAAMALVAGGSPAWSAETRLRMSEADTASYIIGKILDNFEYRGREKLGTWSIENPVVTYTHPFFEILFTKHVAVEGDFEQTFNVHFKINVADSRRIEISTGVLHVECVSNCVDVVSNEQAARYPYFWINAVKFRNNMDAVRVSRAFAHLQTFNNVRREPFD
jgi:hypothetical protein